jgi:LPXTG-site transpeptidase (sortase) family protein
VLITLGLLLGLFVVYSLWWTDVLADRQADVDGQRLRQSWVAQSRPHSDGVPRPDYRRGEEIGFLRIPRLGRDYQLPVALGTDLDILNQGVAGAYLAPYRSAMPWDRSGNFAMAAHRDGHGAAFHNLPELRPGDRIGFETRDTWYLYTVARVLPRTDKFDVGVVAPVPRGSGFHGPGRYITLTTCTPAYTSLYRMAVWGRLTETIPVDVDRDIPSQLQ